MKYKELFEVVKNLEFDKEKTLCVKNGIELFIYRPSKLSKRFKNYDLKKNFQIWLRKGEREFRPNHLRILIDLNLRIRARRDLKKILLIIFDNIFYGKDPDEEIKKVEKEKFKHYLNSLRIIANLTQLFIIEQEYCYYKESKFDPPSLFLQGWIREFIDSPKEIDNMCMSVVKGNPPNSYYINKENKKGKGYQSNLEPLWYLKD